jgi:uncharacterized protein
MENLKFENFTNYIKEKGKDGVVIAFSGGVDSAALAAVCHNLLGDKAVAVTAKSPTLAAEEMKCAVEVAREIGIKHYTVDTDELSNKKFVKNPDNRCYYCKKELFLRLQNFAQNGGFKAVFEGTNFSDLAGQRPGIKAVKERKNIYSPWAENKFTKEEIREIAKKLGLSIHDKPASSCLASRIPFGEHITEERLHRVEEAELIIKKISNVRQLRVRDHNGLARIEVGKDEMPLLFDAMTAGRIVEELKKLGYRFVTLDLEGYRSGSMLEKMAEK